MSATTPAASTPEGTSPTNATTTVSDSSIGLTDRAIIEYLRSKGYKGAEKEFIAAVEGGSSEDKGKKPDISAAASAIAQDEFVQAEASQSQRARTGSNAPQEHPAVLQGLGNTSNIQTLLASIDDVDAEEILSLDPADKQEGFRELEAWVDGSLDMYRPEFRPILFPIFCHFYLDLVQYGFKDAAIKFHTEFSPSLAPIHHATLHHLATLLLPFHVKNDELAQRFRNEKYTIRMSRTGFSLLVGWLTEGIGGEATGRGEGFAGENGKRGRSAVMRVVNNHLRFDVVSSTTTSISPNAWEESTGFLSSAIPQTDGTAINDPQSFNQSKGGLKLGDAPISEELRAETERVLKEQAMGNRSPGSLHDHHQFMRTPVSSSLVSPSQSDLPPYPPSFKSVDVKREIEKVRDARKCIRLDRITSNAHGSHGASTSTLPLPSICTYTIHDAGEGVPSCTFSQDTSLMAAGFSESYIRSSLRKVREKGGSTTRKLVGHSGPVYSVAFDPTGGSATPPRYLLSASADATTRLWSLDTMTNVVAYRGHQNPVWDAQWGPMGIYFATASRDRTARLWSTDRTSTLRVESSACSASDFIQTPFILRLGLVIGQPDYGTSRKGIVSSLAFSPDGRYLASAGEDLAINLWDLGSGKRIKKMTGHTASIYSLAFSAESQMLVSGGADWTVRCWDVASPGGLPPKSRENGSLVNGSGVGGTIDGSHGKEEESIETTDLLTTFPTKRTPIINAQFTSRNLCLVAGPYLAPEQR
ncbi:uncharacterized protein FIBRA_07412 [Fibroporia radiculosa]|uniref:TFIID subunit TAF5 NTD2 domain-containing protein n=1 Tax=Fibroporia radiculosa TaxID=599839 RepID=J4GED0_9APHY|nr:uncharacterized protein FIBRA_07412 [Fibroporia radiculosa]CCM05203.1 predicted protein [Fibroporia radiculosa]